MNNLVLESLAHFKLFVRTLDHFQQNANSDACNRDIGYNNWMRCGKGALVDH